MERLPTINTPSTMRMRLNPPRGLTLSDRDNDHSLHRRGKDAQALRTHHTLEDWASWAPGNYLSAVDRADSEAFVSLVLVA
jgi:hypothetical protein